ncbi:amidase [Curvivirga sp.]|uniref:amidase n=1 Tax=Curvivirga sp. TaxID=2856848 RepID=UPI003B5BCB10
MNDPFNAFIREEWQADATGEGKLNRMTFAVKDIFHMAGHKNSFGNPDWLRTHDAATQNAPVIEKLLAAGATGRGATHTVEMAFSLIGHNSHYGTPINPNALDCDPGGSSSGSASAVAGGLVDFALGSDTSGSVRIPSSHCGLYGLRPTHNRIPLEGILPLAPGFDTIGWFARDPQLLRRVGQVLFDDWETPSKDLKFLAPKEIWDQASPAVVKELLPKLEVIAEIFGDIKEVELTSPNETIEDWFNSNRHVQGWEIWQTHKDWVEKEKPTFSDGVAGRMEWAQTVTEAEWKAGEEVRAEVANNLKKIIGDGTILVFPSSHEPAPLRDLPVEEMEAYRFASLRMTCLSGITGTPQITMPLGRVNRRPVGLSFLAWRGNDEKLLALAEALGGEAKNGLAQFSL